MKAQIQGDELRVSSKSRDDLQSVQALIQGPGVRLCGPVYELSVTGDIEPSQRPVRRPQSAGVARTSLQSTADASLVRSSALGQDANTCPG